MNYLQQITPPSAHSTVNVMVIGYFYALEIDAHQHRVAINGSCTCYLGRYCPAVEVVRTYLAGGGKRAERPPFGFYPVAPAKCPICGAEVFADISLSSANRGMGWICKNGGAGHYWKQRGNITRKRRELAARGMVV